MIKVFKFEQTLHQIQILELLIVRANLRHSTKDTIDLKLELAHCFFVTDALFLKFFVLRDQLEASYLLLFARLDMALSLFDQAQNLRRHLLLFTLHFVESQFVGDLVPHLRCDLLLQLCVQAFPHVVIFDVLFVLFSHLSSVLFFLVAQRGDQFFFQFERFDRDLTLVKNVFKLEFVGLDFPRQHLASFFDHRCLVFDLLLRFLQFTFESHHFLLIFGEPSLQDRALTCILVFQLSQEHCDQALLMVELGFVFE
jgi:hypothetical protein